jgi:hypothetical protein
MLVNDISTQKYFFWFSIFLIVLFTFLEPASTSEVTFWQRLFIWTLQISILVPSLIVFHILLQLIPVFDRLNDWFKILLSGLMGCLFFMPFSLSIDYVMGLDDWSQVQNLAQAKDIIFEEIGGVFPPALLTWAAMNAPRILQLNFSNTELNAKVEKSSLEVTSENIKNEPSQHENEFVAKFSNSIGLDIIYMMSELHYVRVVTAIGETLVLHNLKDAIAELPSTYQGVQTHRSFWVATKFIESIKEKNGQNILILSTGKTIPVSRRKLPEVKEFLVKKRHDAQTSQPKSV